MKRTLSKTTSDTFVELDQFVVHASIQWEFHWTLINRDSFQEYRDPVFNRWLYWYSAAKDASLIAAITWIAKFFEKNNSSINIHHFLQQLGSEAGNWSIEIKAIEAILKKAEPTAKDITFIRSNYFVHKSRKLTFDETFARTTSKYDHVREVIEHMRQCLVVVSKAIGGQETITDLPTQKTLGELTDIMKRLKESPAAGRSSGVRE